MQKNIVIIGNSLKLYYCLIITRFFISTTSIGTASLSVGASPTHHTPSVTSLSYTVYHLSLNFGKQLHYTIKVTGAYKKSVIGNNTKLIEMYQILFRARAKISVRLYC